MDHTKELIALAHDGSKEARDILVLENMGLVYSIARRFAGRGYEMEDINQIGTIGLIKAINTFDINKNIRLSSYASRCIENEILMHFRNTRKSAQDVSLSETIDTDKDGNPLTLIDVLSFETDFAGEIDLKIKSSKLAGYIKSELDDREQKVIIMRYGLDGREPLTQREVAEKLNISRSYISRIEKKALSVLRKKYERD